MKHTRQLIQYHLPNDLAGLVVLYCKCVGGTWNEKACNGQYESCMKCPPESASWALEGASRVGHYYIVQMLLNKFPDVWDADATSYAIMNGHVDILKMLRAHHPCPIPMGIVGYAVSREQVEMVQYLLESKITTPKVVAFYTEFYEKQDIFP